MVVDFGCLVYSVLDKYLGTVGCWTGYVVLGYMYVCGWSRWDTVTKVFSAAGWMAGINVCHVIDVELSGQLQLLFVVSMHTIPNRL